jgi:hypothetical protein
VLQDYFFAGQLKPVVRGMPMLLSFSKPVVTHEELYEMVCSLVWHILSSWIYNWLTLCWLDNPRPVLFGPPHPRIKRTGDDFF